LKSKVDTEKAKTKLLVDLMPRIKHIKGGFIHLKYVEKRRRGDNAPLVHISIKGTEKHEKLTKKIE
jgi:ribosomal protein L17